MWEYWIVYELATGEYRWRGMGPIGAAAQQTLPDGLAALAVPPGAFDGDTPNLDKIKPGLVQQVNASAGALRARYITDIPGQQATYLSKEIEAKAWVTGADPADYPYLAAEASNTGRTIAEVAELIRSTAAAWRALDAQLEGRRRGASEAIVAATTLGAAIMAASVDWNALAA